MRACRACRTHPPLSLLLATSILEYNSLYEYWTPKSLYRVTNMGHAIIKMPVEVAKVSEIPTGTMKRVTAFNEHILLSNVGGKIYATQNDCGHQRASLARGKLEGNIVT